MIVNYDGKRFEFSECDTKGRTQEEVQRMTDETGHMQYEPHNKWLVVSGIGYGWEVK